MCGIYGKLSSHQIDASIAQTATDRLVHAVPTSGRTALQLAQCKNDRGLRAISPSFFPAYRCPSEPDTVPAALRAPAPAMAAPDEIQVAQNG